MLAFLEFISIRQLLPVLKTVPRENNEIVQNSKKQKLSMQNLRVKNMKENEKDQTVKASVSPTAYLHNITLNALH